MKRRNYFLLLLAGIALCLVQARSIEPPKSVAVIELFTSQGCSSCPPADRLLMETASKAATAHQPVYALSFHVDYWDRLGWRDPFSDARFTARQRYYARQLKQETVYTPQAVVNGKQAFVGSNRAQLTTFLADALNQPASATIQAMATQKEQTVVVQTKLSGALAGAVLNVALVSNSVSTVVSRGENSGRTLTHNNVVRSFATVQATENSQVSLPVPANFDSANGAVITYLQSEKTGAIFGAQRATLSK